MVGVVGVVAVAVVATVAAVAAVEIVGSNSKRHTSAAEIVTMFTSTCARTML